MIKNGIEGLVQLYPWPETKPVLKKPMQTGWFHGKQRSALEPLFRERIGKDTSVILEIGAMTGMSTKFFLNAAPNCTVISLDHWMGTVIPKDKKHRNEKGWELPPWYESFLINRWGSKDRIIPLRESSQYGMAVVSQFGIMPDLVYVDAGHKYQNAYCDLDLAIRLFPDAEIVGDDWQMDSVKFAVQDCIEKYDHLEWKARKSAWWIEKKS